MRLSSLILGVIVAVAVIAVVLAFFGVTTWERPLTAQGAALYSPANEVVLKGVVQEVSDFTCPVSEGEMGTHLLLMTADGVWQVHLAPGRIMRNQKFKFSTGDQLSVLGAKVRINRRNGVMAREITRGNETFLLRDPQGTLLLVQ